jgi:hypothetical protein
MILMSSDEIAVSDDVPVQEDRFTNCNVDNNNRKRKGEEVGRPSVTASPYGPSPQ